MKEVKNLISSVISSEVIDFKLDYDDVKIKVKSNTGNKTKQNVKSILNKNKLSLLCNNDIENKETTRFIKNETLSMKVTTNIVVKSPFIGTFFLPSINTSNCIKVGGKIRKGDLLCLVESLKLFNELKSEISGEIIKIFLKEGSPVGFGEPLFIVNSDLL
ncbi:biotin/lipoyl-containing protein [Aquimarina sp. RZ0]|uniref:acetyl-CoA carboxylase biotin carboxyl carrier protein n=1 Tax=Aquimarina sp. RZ0 TaxID=2607730 RepID=UPI001CB73BB2|nr:biotin/lipoyl-containing protein [Aquimarina sp. RZ0]